MQLRIKLSALLTAQFNRIGPFILLQDHPLKTGPQIELQQRVQYCYKSKLGWTKSSKGKVIYIRLKIDFWILCLYVVSQIVMVFSSSFYGFGLNVWAF